MTVSQTITGLLFSKTVLFIPLALESTLSHMLSLFFYFICVFFSIKLMCIVFTNAGHFFFYVFVVIPKVVGTPLLALPLSPVCHVSLIRRKNSNQFLLPFLWYNLTTFLNRFLRNLVNAAGRTTLSHSSHVGWCIFLLKLR